MKSRHAVGCLLLIIQVGVTRGDYVTLLGSDQAYGGTGASSLVGKSAGWSDKQTPHDDADYYVGSGVVICTPNVSNDSSTYTFLGRSLTLDGGMGNVVMKHCSKSTSTMDFGSGDVCLKSGIYSFDADGKNVKMNAVVESSLTEPFCFSYNVANDQNKNLQLSLSGGATTALSLTRTDANRSLIWNLSGTAADFMGTLLIDRITVLATDYPIGGTLRLGEGAVYKSTGSLTDGKQIGAVDLAGGKFIVQGNTTCDVGMLLSSGGGEIAFPSFHTGSATPANYGALNVLEGVDASDKIRIVLDESSYGADAMKTIGRGEYPLIRFAKGCVVSADDFELVVLTTIRERSGTNFPTPWTLLVKNDTSGAPVLFAVRKEVEEFVGNSSVRYGLEDGTVWSDGKTPHEGVDYLAFGSSCKFGIRGVSQSFGGDSLLSYYGATYLYADTFTIPSWTVRGEHAVYVGAESVRVEGGKLTVPYHNGVWAKVLAMSEPASQALEIASDLDGDGYLTLNELTYTGDSNLKDVTLSGCNSSFKGKLAFNRKLRVRVGNGSALGGALPATDLQAVRFYGTCKLETMTGGAAFVEATRGLMFAPSCQLKAVENGDLSISNPITVLGGEEKYGAGTLALGGPLYFGEDSAVTPGTSTDYYLAIREGWVKPLSAQAFDGLRLYFDKNAAGVKLDWAPKDDAVRTLGLVTAKENKSGHLAVASGKRITFAFDTGDVTSYPNEESVHGLCTVPTAEAATVRGLIAVAKPFPRVKAEVLESDNGDGTTTFSVRVSQPGLVLFIR